MTHAIPGLTDDTSLDTRNPPPDLGPGIGRIESTTIHQSEVGAAPGQLRAAPRWNGQAIDGPARAERRMRPDPFDDVDG